MSNYREVDFWKRKFFGSEALLKAAMAGNHQQLSPTEKKLLTKEMLELFTIETLTYCNRKCDYCPVSQSDFRQSRAAQKKISRTLFDRMIHDLAEIDYDKMLSFTGYSEPLYDEDLPALITYARQKLPRAHLMIYSNGDILDHAIFLKLLSAGLNKIIITLHPAPNKLLTKKEIARRLKQLLKRLQFPFTDDDVQLWVEDQRRCLLNFLGMSLQIEWPNWRVSGTWRGGLVDVPTSSIRTQPCLLPFREMMVFFDGATINCCHAYYDPTLADDRNVIDRVSETNSIFDVFCHEKFNRFRRHLFGYQEKKGICSRCSYLDVTDGQDKDKRQKMLAELAQEDAVHAMIFAKPSQAKPSQAKPSQMLNLWIEFGEAYVFRRSFFLNLKLDRQSAKHKPHSYDSHQKWRTFQKI